MAYLSRRRWGRSRVYLRAAEAERNRTSQAEILGFNGFEARDCPLHRTSLTCTNRR